MAREGRLTGLGLVVVACLLACAAAQTSVTMTLEGTVNVTGNSDNPIVHLQMKDQLGQKTAPKELSFIEDLVYDGSMLNSGDLVQVNVTACQDSLPGCKAGGLLVSGMKILRRGIRQDTTGHSMDAVASMGLPKQLGEDFVPTIIFILSICGQPASTTPSALLPILFDGLPNSNSRNIQKLARGCSFGKYSFNSSHVKIVETVIPIPCTGQAPSTGTKLGTDLFRFEAPQCDYDDQVGWAKFTEEYYRNTLKATDLDRYPRRAFVLPREGVNPRAFNCSFGGAASQGCPGFYTGCYMWINGGSALAPRVWWHEMGHTLMSDHAAGLTGDEYGDQSDSLGCCDRLVCYNAPHMYFQGWASPLVRLNALSLPVATWRTYTIPAKQTSDTNFVTIRATWIRRNSKNRFQPDYYLSYVTRVGEDSTQDTLYNNRVLVHMNIDDGYNTKTRLWAAVATGVTWYSSNTTDVSGLVVRHISRTATAAQVAICRQDSPDDCAVPPPATRRML
jgi:hypothetical protein